MIALLAMASPSCPILLLPPAAASYSGIGAISSGSAWTNCHVVNVGIPALATSNNFIPLPLLPQVGSAKRQRNCSVWPASTTLAALPGTVARVVAGDAIDRTGKGASDGFARSVRVVINRVLDSHRGGHYEPSHEFSGEEIKEVPNNFEAALQENGSLVVDDSELGNGDKGEKWKRVSGICQCHVCGRRVMMAVLGGLLASSGSIPRASATNFESSDYNVWPYIDDYCCNWSFGIVVSVAIRELVHPARPAWYEELYAQTMAKTMVSYEAEVADYKRQLFLYLNENVEHILELGIGTGPNLKYYGKKPHLQRVVGVDPNLQMGKYCTESAAAAGLSNLQFEFLNAVGEGIPVRDESIDAVVCTLTLCSVTDVALTLEEVKRVLKPGGAFLFVEHVAAPDGTGLRFWQGLLDPLQQWVADGCHLTRNTLQYIVDAQFGSVYSESFTVASVSLLSPHIMGVAYK